MKLIILGSGTCLPSTSRHPAGYLLDTGEELLLIDCSDGTLNQIAHAGYDPMQITTILISHGHLDHFAGLFALLMSYMVAGRTNPLSILCPPDLHAKLLTLLATLDTCGTSMETSWLGTHYQRIIDPLEPGNSEQPFGKLTVMQLVHADLIAYGYRIEVKDKAIVYSGDTEYCPALISLCKKADAAILDCSFPNGTEANGHLTPGLAGMAATEAKAKHLILSHIYPETDRHDLNAETQTSFIGKITVARDLLSITV
ncbi:MAG TPA: MBL fold metallo-hydrolase [bacterium]|nr:MBL fold metallo-hydrolase [bacterium]